MIFNTFDSDIDSLTSKIGVLGKSFDELGIAISDAFDKAFGNFGDNASFWKTLKDNLSPKDENGESWVKNELGEIVSPDNIDSFIAELDIDSAKEKLKEIFAQEELIDSEHTWEDYFETLEDGGKEYIPDLIKNTEDLSKLTSEDLVNANQAARNTALAHNAALEKQTMSAKAGKIAMSGLAMAGNMFVDMLITKGIELAVTAIDKYVNRVKYAKEAMEEAQQAIDEAQNNLKNVSTTISENKDRFLELSKGVDKFSNNKFLSDDDYAEFLSISQEIAEIAPELVSGYDEQGNALLRIGETAEETNHIFNDLIETQKDLANQALADNLDKIATGVKYSVQETQREIDNLTNELKHVQNNTDVTSMNIESTFFKNGALSFDDNQFIKYGKQMEQALKSAGLNYKLDKYINQTDFVFTDTEVPIDKLKKAQEYFDLSIEMQNKAYSAEEAGLKKDIDKKEKLIEEHYQKMSENLTAWVRGDYKYQSLNETNQSFVDQLIPSINWNEVQKTLGLDSLSAEDYKTYIQESIVNPLATVTDEQKKTVNKYISNLLNFDDGDLGIISYGEKAQQYFDENNIGINISPIFADEKEAFNKLQNSIKAIAGENEEDLKILQNYTSDFTRDEANRFEQVALGAKSAREAIVLYISTLQTDYSSSVDELNSSITSMTETQELLNSALDEQSQNGTLSQETIASLKEKYDDLDKVIEITTNGIIINKDKLAELNAEEKKAITTDMASTREKLVDQYNANSLAIANYKMQLEDTNSITDEQKAAIEALLSVKKDDQKQTEEQLAQMDLLGVEYDQLNSKTNAFLKSLSSADSGAIYDSVHSALEQVKQVYDAGDYGKDEFRNFVDYMTFDDMSTAPIEEVVVAYQKAMNAANTYFTEGNKGLSAFINKMEQFGMATKDANGNWDLSIDSIDTLAKKLGISSDAVQDILNKLKDKGWEINIATSDDGLVDVDKELDKLEKKLDKLEKERKNIKPGMSTEEIDNKIQVTKQAISDIKAEIKVYANTEEARSQILNLQSQIEEMQEKGKEDFMYYAEHQDDIKSLIEEQQKIADDNNIDLEAVLKANTKPADEQIEETKNKAEETTTLDVDAYTKKATDKIDNIFNETYYLKLDVDVKTRKSLASKVKDKVDNVLNGIFGKKESGDGNANGTAIFGRAYANGKRGKISKGYKNKALVGELGAEMRVRDGKYEILGENGAEFTDVRPDDIIFNAEQTKEILKNGQTNTRGNAYNTGVYGGGMSLEEHTTSASKKKKAKSDSKKGTKKDTKDTEKSLNKFKETIDWCAETINKATSVIDKINAKLGLTNSSLSTQIKNYKQLLNHQQSLINGYSKTTSVYKKEYTNSLSKLSKSDRKKVEDGTYTIEQFKGKTKSDSKKKSKAEKRYNKIQKALEARDTYLSSQTELVNAKQQFQEYAEALASVRWEDASEKVDKLNSQLGVLDTRMGNASGYEAKNAILDEQLELQKQILDTQEKAVKKTQADANSYYKKISKKNKKNKNEDGTIKLEGVTNKKQIEYIKAYNAYVKQLADQTVALAQAQEDYKASVNDIKLKKVDNIKTDYDNRISMFEDAQSRIEHEISLTEAQGQVASASYYDMLTNNARNIRNVRMSEKAALKEQLNGVTEYSDTWYSLKQQIFDVDRAIEEQTRNAVENTNKQIDAMKELTSLVNEQISGATDALAWFDDLIEAEDLYDDDGNLTNKAYTSLKLKEGQIAGSQTRLGNYNKNMAELEAKYANGDIEEAKYLTEKLELEKNIRDEYKTQIDLRKEQNELIKDGYRAQKEALDKILEKKKKSLDYDLSEYNYRKSIAEKTKSITDLEKQLAMLQGDNSEEAKAKRQQIEVQLKENKEDLKDTQYEKYIERYEDAMDNLSDRLDALIEKIDALPKEQIIQVIVNNEAKADEGTKEISQETEVPIETLGDTGQQVVENPIEQAPQTFTEASNNAEQAYEPPAVQVETPNPQQTIIEPEPVVVAQPEPQPAQQPVYPTEQDIRNGKLAWLKALTEETIRNTGVRAESADPDWHEINKYIWSKTGNKLPQDSLSSLADFAYQNGLADASIVARGSKGNLTSGAKDILLNLLRESGYANGGIVGQIQKVVKANGDDGLATLKVGEAVLTTQQTEDFREFVKYLRPLNNMFEVISQPSIPIVNRTANSSSTSIDSVNFEFNLPNVVDSESLIKTIQTDTKLQRTLQNATVGKLNGNTKFGVNRL